MPSFAKGSVAAIGVFDGVHRGHQALLRRARQIADRRNLPLVVITFHPHPLAVVRPEAEPAHLTTIGHRVALLGEAGATGVRLLSFTAQMARMSAADFVQSVLVTELGASHVVVGQNFRFGHRASGDTVMLRDLGREAGFGVDAVMLTAGERGQIWSSSHIREALHRGDVQEAAIGLGRLHRVTGVVVHGDHRGRDLGYPTANLDPAGAGYGGEAAIPADGVYAGRLLRFGGAEIETLPAAISVGTNPTFAGERDRRVEAYVLDRDDLDLYGEVVAVEFVQRLRGMTAFAGLPGLLAQMRTDVDRCRSILRTS